MLPLSQQQTNAGRENCQWRSPEEEGKRKTDRRREWQAQRE